MTKPAPHAEHMTPDARYQYLVEQVRQNQQLWTLQDADGCVMLTTADEDCIPMWPSEASAKMWACDEWADCIALPISLKDWLARWVPGMQADELFVAVYPVPTDVGLVIPPHELKQRLTTNTRR